MSAGSATGEPGLFEAVGVVADECGVYDVLALLATELACVLVKIDGQMPSSVMSELKVTAHQTMSIENCTEGVECVR